MMKDKSGLSLNELCSHAYRVADNMACNLAAVDPVNMNGKGNYVLMLPRQGKAWIGFGKHQIVRYKDDRFIIEDEDGKVKEVTSDAPLDSLAQVLDNSANYFFMISLDLHRPGAASALPTMVWVRAKYEVTVDVSQSEPFSPANEAAGSAELANSLNRQYDAGEIQSVNPPGGTRKTDWSTEHDEVFVDRLERAVQALQEIDGKVIVARTYYAPMDHGLDPFRLYEIYNQLESACAASHFCQLDEDVFSLGCTPENIFSLQNNTLDFDVVASTRGISSDPEKDARWEQELLSDSKELKEHNMALGRYQQRLGELCKAGTVVMDHHLEVRRFRHVRHLYSHLYGELLDSISLFDLIKGSSPALSTYPDELIPVADDGVMPTRFYGGVVGRTGASFTDADVFLNLRSLFITPDEISTRGGVGVVRESKPEQELIEVKNKLRCVMEAEALWKGEADGQG